MMTEVILFVGFALYVAALWGAKIWEVRQLELQTPETLNALKKVLNTWRLLSMGPFPVLILVLFLTENGVKVFHSLLGFWGVTLVWGGVLLFLLRGKFRKMDLVPEVQAPFLKSFSLRYTGELALLVSLGFWLLKNIPDGLP